MIILEELQVWKKAIELAKDVYKVSKLLPKEEFINFLSIANGSSYELHSFITLAHELNYLDLETKKSILDKNNHVIRMNVKLQDYLKQNLKK